MSNRQVLIVADDPNVLTTFNGGRARAWQYAEAVNSCPAIRGRTAQAVLRCRICRMNT